MPPSSLPAVPPLPSIARIYPPPEVQAAVGAALRACHGWQPSAVPPAPPGEAPSSWPWTASTVEAGVCDMIDDWPKAPKDGAALMLGAGLALGLLVATLLLVTNHVLGVLWQTRLGWWARLGWFGHRWSGHLWQVVLALAVAVSGDVLVASVATSALTWAGMGASQASVLLNCLSVVFAIVGLCFALQLVQNRRDRDCYHRLRDIL